MECPRCRKELNQENPMVIDGHSLRCRLCGYKIPMKEEELECERNKQRLIELPADTGE